MCCRVIVQSSIAGAASSVHSGASKGASLRLSMATVTEHKRSLLESRLFQSVVILVHKNKFVKEHRLFLEYMNAIFKSIKCIYKYFEKISIFAISSILTTCFRIQATYGCKEHSKSYVSIDSNHSLILNYYIIGQIITDFRSSPLTKRSSPRYQRNSL